ncbi:C2 domain containing protein [Histomonas meleagridis]|uniref:C2 domain containing protein n=1 Tax=Histomonas meleagridis TaxID=135588 RepID=UPI00355965E1|nr:C2 domain containing protein [Histomonas meleagridis]KAH0800283.1 C2 domain containing protein [Histomonas meleagridis]
MIDVYVSSACNLPSADSNGFSDPYVELWSDETWASQYLGKMYYGKNKYQSKTLDPVWDAEFSKPFQIPFVLSSYLGFKIYDHDTFTFDDYLGYAKIKLTPESCNKVLTLPVETSHATKGPPSLTIKYCPPTTNFPTDPNYKKYQNIYSYITYTPTDPSYSSIFLDAYIIEFSTSLLCYPLTFHLSFYKTSKLAHEPHLGPSGLTDVFRFNIKKFDICVYSDKCLIFFVVTAKDYSGEVTLNYLGAPKEHRNFHGNKKLKNPEKYKIINTSTIHVNANELQVFPLALGYTKKNLTFEEIQFQPAQTIQQLLSQVCSYYSSNKRCSLRLEMTPNIPITLSTACRMHQIEMPKRICISTSPWASTACYCKVYTYKQSECKFVAIEKFWARHTKNENESIVLAGSYKERSRKLLIDLERLPNEAQLIPIYATSFSTIDDDGNITIYELANIRGVSIRILDEKDGYELLDCIPPKKTSVLILAVLMRNKFGMWNLYSCMKPAFLDPDFCDGFIDEFVNDQKLISCLMEMDEI